MRCEAFLKLTGAYGVPADKVLVFHARFAGIDRQRIEAEVLRRFGKNDVTLPRSGHILLASQVVEQIGAAVGWKRGGIPIPTLPFVCRS